MRNPEQPPIPRGESGDTSEFREWLDGMRELAHVEGMGRPDFLRLALDDLGSRGMSLDPFRLSAIMGSTFGSVDKLLEELRGMSVGEFGEKYPGIADIVSAWHPDSQVNE